MAIYSDEQQKKNEWNALQKWMKSQIGCYFEMIFLMMMMIIIMVVINTFLSFWRIRFVAAVVHNWLNDNVLFNNNFFLPFSFLDHVIYYPVYLAIMIIIISQRSSSSSSSLKVFCKCRVIFYTHTHTILQFMIVNWSNRFIVLCTSVCLCVCVCVCRFYFFSFMSRFLFFI